MGESRLESDTFVDYAECIQNDYAFPTSSPTSDLESAFPTGGRDTRRLVNVRECSHMPDVGPLIGVVSRKKQRIYPIGASTCGHSGRRKTVNFGTSPTVALKKTTPAKWQICLRIHFLPLCRIGGMELCYFNDASIRDWR